MKGGHRLKKKIKDRQGMLIDALYKKHGGVTKIAKKLDDVTAQDLINWRNRCAIPIKYCHRVSKVLDCTIYALNYDDMCFFYDGGFPWDLIVEGCCLPKAIEAKLLNKEK